MIRLICSDVDGTLVQDGSKNINPEYFDVICKLRAKGIQVAIASGRPESSISSLFKPIEEKIFFIAAGGAMISTCSRQLFAWALPEEIWKKMIVQMRQIPTMEVQVNGTKCSYLETKDEEFWRWVTEDYGIDAVRMDDLLEIDDEIISLNFYNREGRIDELMGDFIREWKDQYKVVRSGFVWLDVSRKDVNKGNAVAFLQDALGIKPEETIAFGDQNNDVEMMRQAYYSCAVGNAVSATKEAARYTIDTCKEEGVLKVLKQLLASLEEHTDRSQTE